MRSIFHVIFWAGLAAFSGHQSQAAGEGFLCTMGPSLIMAGVMVSETDRAPQNSAVEIQFEVSPGKWENECSGVMIEGDGVTTAAHCLDGKDLSKLQVCFGSSRGHCVKVSGAETRRKEGEGLSFDVGVILLKGRPPSFVKPAKVLAEDQVNAVLGEKSQTLISPAFGTDQDGVRGIFKEGEFKSGKVEKGVLFYKGAGAGPQESKIGNGDSGGGVFVWSGDGWKLAALNSKEEPGTSGPLVGPHVQWMGDTLKKLREQKK